MSAFLPIPAASRQLFSATPTSRATTITPLPHVPHTALPATAAAIMRVAAPTAPTPNLTSSDNTITTSKPPVSRDLQLNSKPTLSSRPSHRRSPSPEPLSAVRALLAQHDYEQARQEFESLLNSPDVEQASQILRSWAFMEASHGDEALSRSLFSRSIRAAATPSVEAAAWNAWALMEQRKANISSARKCFLHGFRVDPTHAPLCQAFAMFEAKWGIKRRARELFALGSELNKSSHRTWIAWANFEASEDNMSRARFLYKTAVTKAHGDDGIAALLVFAKFEERQKQFSRARDLFREGLQRYGEECPKILHAWGTLESHAGNYERSRQLFLSTLQCPAMSGPAVAPTYQAWALAEKKVGNIPAARKLFARGAEANPHHVYIWQAWGIMEQRCKNIDAAREYFKKGTEADEFNAPTWNAWARMEAEETNYEEARRLFKRATEVDPSHAKSWQAWAVLEGKLRDRGCARLLFKQAVAADPTCAPAWQAWACMEENAGNIETARDLFQKGVDANPVHIAVWQAWYQMETRQREWSQGPACSLVAPGSQ